MGKKVKKLVKKATKFVRKIDPLMGGDVVLDAVGLPSVFGEEHGFATKADREAKLLAQQQGREDASLASTLQQQRDEQADLTTENVADIRSGDAASSSRKRQLSKQRSRSLSAQLGIG